MDILPVGKFILELTKVIHSAWSKIGEKRAQRTELGAFLHAYGSATRLSAFSNDLLVYIESPSHSREYNTDHLKMFCQEMENFGYALQELNLLAIEIYYPGFGNRLRGVIAGDLPMMEAIRRHLSAQGEDVNAHMPKVLELYGAHFSGPRNWQHGSVFYFPFDRGRVHMAGMTNTLKNI